MIESAASDAQLYARSFADVYDEWYGELDDPAVLVDAVTARCEPGATVLELGSGTGRLAMPLDQAGFVVIALDASTSMLQQAKAGPAPLASDMANLPVQTASVNVALIAYNTFFNLDSPHQQQRCLAEVARVLQKGGFLIIEAFVAPSGADAADFGLTIKQHPRDGKKRLAILTGADADNPGVIIGSHVELGAMTTCRPWRLRYQSPGELDQNTSAAGFALSTRATDWSGNTFDEDSDRHVSWYERI